MGFRFCRKRTDKPDVKTFSIKMVMVALVLSQASGIAQASCTTTREYITSLEYLRSRKESAMADTDAQKVARQVAKGCTGAAGRFIRISTLLQTTGLGPK